MALLTGTGLRIIRYSSIAYSQFFKMAAVRHLGFSKVGNVNFRSHSEAQYASPSHILRRSAEPLRRFCQFSIFQDGGGRHLGFWKIQVFNGWDGTLKSVELSLHAKFWRNRSKCIWNMAIFQFFEMAAVRRLGFSKVGNFNFRSHSEAQYALPGPGVWQMDGSTFVEKAWVFLPVGYSGQRRLGVQLVKAPAQKNNFSNFQILGSPRI